MIALAGSRAASTAALQELTESIRRRVIQPLPAAVPRPATGFG